MAFQIHGPVAMGLINEGSNTITGSFSYYDTEKRLYVADINYHKIDVPIGSRQRTVDLTGEKIYVSFEDLSFFTQNGESPPSVNKFRDYLVAQLVAVRNKCIFYEKYEDFKRSNDFECEFRIPAQNEGGPDKFFVLNFDLNKIYGRHSPTDSIKFKKLKYITSDDTYRRELMPREGVYTPPKTNPPPPEHPTTEGKTLVINNPEAKSEEITLHNNTDDPPAPSMPPAPANRGWRQRFGWGGQRKPVKRSRKIFKNIKSKRSRKYRKYLRNKR